MLASLPFGSILLFAQDTRFLSEHFWPGFVGTIVYAVFALALVLLGFKLFDWITPRIDIEKELAEKHNIAVAVVVGSMIFGVCYVIAHVVL